MSSDPPSTASAPRSSMRLLARVPAPSRPTLLTGARELEGTEEDERKPSATFASVPSLLDLFTRPRA